MNKFNLKDVAYSFARVGTDDDTLLVRKFRINGIEKVGNTFLYSFMSDGEEDSLYEKYLYRTLDECLKEVKKSMDKE